MISKMIRKGCYKVDLQKAGSEKNVGVVRIKKKRMLDIGMLSNEYD